MKEASHNSPITKDYYSYKDFKVLASHTMSKQNFNYYYSGYCNNLINLQIYGRNNSDEKCGGT